MSLARESQLNQDVKCIEYHKYKKNGYFVDIGAYDGIDLSNTFTLETAYDWTGICVEPVLNNFKQCEINRPNSICVNKCIYDSNGKVPFDEVKNNGDGKDMLSGICDEDTKTCSKECITFTKLLDDNNAPNIIDFLSLDTEGSELKILQSLDHDKYTIKYLTVEHNCHVDYQKQIQDFLKSKGYEYLETNHWDDIFIKN